MMEIALMRQIMIGFVDLPHFLTFAATCAAGLFEKCMNKIKAYISLQ